MSHRLEKQKPRCFMCYFNLSFKIYTVHTFIGLVHKYGDSASSFSAGQVDELPFQNNQLLARLIEDAKLLHNTALNGIVLENFFNP